MSAPREGDVIAARYRLDRRLGAGGMGVVWAATHLVTHKTLALKFIHQKTDEALSRSARKRALREARATCAVSHPNVVTVHDVLEGEDETPILVMDLLQGESLAERLAREKTIATKDALAIARDVLLALDAAHAAGVVHRDLKPDNVFLCAGGGVRILDFGVAKLKGQDAATKETHRLTETGAMIGTPQYMSPEQAFGESDVDLRADLWAVGAVLYECIAGAPPASGTNLGQILKKLAKGEITPLRERVPTAPPEVTAIVDRLLAIERESRPQSAKEVIDAIDAVKDAPATKLAVEQRDTAPPSTRTTVGARRGGRGIVTVAVAALAMAAIAAVGWRTFARPAVPVATPEPPPTITPVTATATVSAMPTVSATATASSAAVATAKRPPPRPPPSAKPADSVTTPLLTNPPF
jgi:serine/threonine-protein kinase